MFDFDIIASYVYLGCKWAPSAPVWWLACRKGSGSLHFFTEIPQRLEISICAKFQSIQMEYTWLNILHQSAVVTEIMKI